MRLGSPNRIDDFESKSRSEFDRRLPSIRISRFVNNLEFNIKLIYFRYKSIKIDRFRYKFDLLINLNRSNVDYLIENS